MTPDVLQAIEAVYEAFQDAKAPSSIAACPCCHEPVEYCALARFPLRELTDENLSGYAFSVFYTVGDRPDFEYFFPRILELATRDGGMLTCREVIFQKLALAGWPDWRKDRRSAFGNYLEAVLAAFGTRVFRDDYELDSWVCSLGFCVGDLASRLDVFLNDTPAAAANLILLYEANSETLVKQRLSNSFWEREQPPHDRIVAWFAQPAVQRRIQEAYQLV